MKDDTLRRKHIYDLLDEDTQVTTKLTMKELDSIMPSRVVPKEEGIKTQLIVLTGAEAGKIHLLGNEDLVGRDINANLRVTDTTVSRKHAVFTKSVNGRYYIEDLGSQNGTWVNGVPLIKNAELRVGDKIRVGVKTVFLFTQQDDIEQQLLELRKMESLGRLARGIAHDFNNLLATIMLNVNYIEVMSDEGEVDPQELQTSLEQTKVALKQAANMTEQLLGFARKGRYEERPRDVSAILREVVGLVERTFDRAIQIDTRIQPSLGVVGDHSQLLQVFMNLCINARDAMPKGGRLTIEAKSEDINSPNVGALSFLTSGPHVIISVSDTGVGMDEKTRRHIFEPFFSTKGLGKGNGLGLATVYGIVKNHGGEIHVESSPDQGTRFVVYLPATELPAPSGAARPQSPARLTSTVDSSGAILLVEDDEKLQAITRKTLEKMGFEVISCIDGIQAVDLFRRHEKQIRLVLLDLVLPRQGGLETFRIIRSISPEVKVVVVSGYSEDSQLRTIMKEGAAAFLKKPCSADALSAVISDILLDVTKTQSHKMISPPPRM
jgi:signal transduction histidine kinase/CheY-like chemotaxis protein